MDDEKRKEYTVKDKARKENKKRFNEDVFFAKGMLGLGLLLLFVWSRERR